MSYQIITIFNCVEHGFLNIKQHFSSMDVFIQLIKVNFN
jgi:hypothetical protein